jgi:flagellar motor protein MotB
MSKDPFSLAVDAAASKPQSSGTAWPRIVMGVLALGLFTLLFGYYWPLSEAHSVLVEQRSSLMSAADGDRKQLERTTSELLEVTKERDDLRTKVQRGDAVRAASTARDEQLLSMVKAGLAPRLKQAQLVVLEAVDGVQVIIDNARIYKDHQESVYPQGQKLLCEVAGALKNSGGQVTVMNEHADPVVKNPMLKRLFPTTWELTAARAATAARVLEGCGIPGKDITPVAGGHFHRRKEAPAKSSGELRLTVTTSNAK